jgi:very-short-patch-repair endonuclease
MAKLNTTPQTKMLCEALIERGVSAEMECWDKHKHVDICVHDAKLYIEIDEEHHYTYADNIERDLLRDNFSSEGGYDTFRIPSTLVDEHLDKITNALVKVVKDRREVAS